MKPTRFLAATGAILLLCASSSRADFTTVSLSTIANGSLQNVLDTGYPSGTPVTLGGVPFDLPDNATHSINNTWFAAYAANQGSGTVSATLNVSIANAVSVNTLINTFWGQAGPTSYASIEFKGTGGADYVYHLVGNSDIRDYNNNVWTNTINGTTTVNVVSLNNGHRLDMQTIALPTIFQSQTLQQIIFTDSGNQNFQRMFVSGVTVATRAVPEPASVALLGIGLLGSVVVVRRARAR